MFARMILCGGVLVGWTQAASAVTTVTVDFNSFNAGDGFAQINAVTSPLGLTFSSTAPAQIVDLGGNKALSLTRDGSTSGLINFAATVEYAELRFLTNDQTTSNDDAAQLDFYSAPQIAGALDLNDYWSSAVTATPGVASLRYSDFWFGTSVIRSMDIGQAGANGVSFLVDDLTVEINAIPEPATCALALAALCLTIRRRR